MREINDIQIYPNTIIVSEAQKPRAQDFGRDL